MESDSQQLPCPECGTPHIAQAKFCESCGVHLGAARSASANPGSVESGSDESSRTAPTNRTRADKQAVKRELTKARTLVKTIRTIFWVITALTALATIGTWMARHELAVQGLNPWIWFGISLAITLLMAAGALFVHLHPLAWTIALASFATLFAGLHIFGGDIGFQMGIWCFVAFGLWASMPILLKVHRLMQEHPDLIDASKLKRRERRDVDVSEVRLRAAERDRQRAKAKLRTFGIVGGVLLAIVAGIVIYNSIGDDKDVKQQRNRMAVAPERTPEDLKRIEAMFAPRIESFQDAWKRSDVAAIEAMLTDDKQRTYWPKVARLLVKRGWDAVLPTVKEPQFFPRGAVSKDVWFDLEPKGTLKTRWKFEDNDAWCIDTLRFANTR